VVDVLTLDRTRNYQTSTRRAIRQVTESLSVQTLSLPLVMSGAEAEAIALKHLYLQWLERVRYAFTLDDAFATLEPTDVITLQEEGITQRLRILRILKDAGRMRVEAVGEDITLYNVVAPLLDTGGTAEAVRPLSRSMFALLDIPAFPNDAPNVGILRIASNGEADGWSGAAIYRGDESGDYSRIIDVGDAAVMGVVTSALAAFTGGNRLDMASSLEVILTGEGALQSVPLLSLLGGANAALVGNEILQFQDVVLFSENKYRLSGFLRGRLGTEDAMAGHVLGERFVLLNQAVADTPIAMQNVGLARNYKAVSIGATLASADPVPFAYTAVALKPYAPVHAKTQGVAGSDITVTWVRRDRLYGAWRDFVDAGFSEALEAYEIEVWLDGTRLRTLSSTISTVTYSELQQSADGVGVGAALSFRIFQISALVGRGKMLSIAV
jgi:hypothetical protein